MFQVSAVDSLGTLTSAGVTVGEMGTVQSLDEGTGAVTLPSAFITFDTGGSNLQLWATNIPAGGTAGRFTLTNVSGGVLAQFAVDGYILNATSGKQQGLFTSTFDAAFPGTTVAQLFGQLPVDGNFCAVVSTGASVASDCNPFAAASSTPEPASAFLMGGGFLIVALLASWLRARRPSFLSELVYK